MLSGIQIVLTAAFRRQYVYLSSNTFVTLMVRGTGQQGGKHHKGGVFSKQQSCVSGGWGKASSIPPFRLSRIMMSALERIRDSIPATTKMEKSRPLVANCLAQGLIPP